MDEAAYYRALKAADAELGESDPAAAASALHGKTRTLENQSFRWRDAKRIARETGDWPRIVTRARQTAADPPVTVMDAAILAAINAAESELDDMIDPTSQAWQLGIGALQAVGDVSPTTAGLLAGLSTVVVRILDRDPTADDVIAARTQF